MDTKLAILIAILVNESTTIWYWRDANSGAGGRLVMAITLLALLLLDINMR